METKDKFSDQTVQSLIELGRQTAGPSAVQTITGNPVPFIICNGAVKPLPELVFNGHEERPERVRAAVSVFDADSFAAYHKKFADANSRCFADETKQTVTCIIDYHEERDKARWGQHRVILNLQKDPAWLAWAGSNNRQMTQQQFSEFLEQNALDIDDPAPAAIREIAGDLQATTEVEFGSGFRGQDGQTRFKYVESTKTTNSTGAVTVPDSFTLALPVFIGGNHGRIQALLRFRLKEGKLTFFYTLVRPEYYIRDAFIASRDAIAKGLGVTIINGVPA